MKNALNDYTCLMSALKRQNFRKFSTSFSHVLVKKIVIHRAKKNDN